MATDIDATDSSVPDGIHDLGHAQRAAEISRIVCDPAYLLADQDLSLLEEDAARGIRLELEYHKANLHLSKHGIEHTIVVFGGARIVSPDIAALKLAAASEALAQNPKEPLLQRHLRLAERALSNSKYYTVAQEFGRLVGRAPNGNPATRLFVMSGGGPGIMEAVHRGAFEVGAKSVGLNIMLPFEQLPNPYITPGLCFNFRYFALRKLHFMQRARALIAFPGGYGTFDELFETLTLVSTKKIPALPIVLVGKEYWQRAIDFEFLIEEGLIGAEEAKLFWYCETAEDIWRSILDWYEHQGQGLFTPRSA